MDRCQQFRDQWLERALDGDALEAWIGTNAHVGECADCAAWVQSTGTHVSALVGMPRLTLPAGLDEHVQGDLHDADARVERALRSMTPMAAPRELDHAVAALLDRGESADEERARKSARASGSGFVRALDYSLVPPVLERLVDEELANADAHVAERFVGNLERRPAPPELEGLVRQVFRPSVFARVATIVSIAAACLVVWLAVRPTESRQPRRLNVVRADSLSQLEPIARGLLEALGGGAGLDPRSEVDALRPSTFPARRDER